MTLVNVKSMLVLWNLVKENCVGNILSQVHKLVETALTPVSTTESESCFSTPKRVQAYLRNSMVQEDLNALTVLNILKDVTADTTRFNQKVIERLAYQK